MSDKRVYLYDSTLRDGQQTQGVDFSTADKTAIAEALDELSIDYIEGGWPGANPTDNAFFANPPKLKNSKLTAFGMTRRAGRSASNDPGLSSLAQNAPIVCMVGKSWDFQVTEALGIELDENLAMISDSIAHLKTKVSEVMFDAEHFFDGYKANRDYALSAIKAAYEAGVRILDSSVAGLGGCPFAPGATGNTATEDLVFTFQNMGIETGIDLARLLDAAEIVAGIPDADTGGHIRAVPRERACPSRFPPLLHRPDKTAVWPACFRIPDPVRSEHLHARRLRSGSLSFWLPRR